MQILEPYTNLVSLGRLQVPSGLVTIDPNHWVANGLILAALPHLGRSGQPSVGAAQPIPWSYPATFSTGYYSSTPEGSGIFDDNTQNSTSLAWFGDVSPTFLTWSQLSIYWRGMHVGNPTNSGVQWDTYLAGISFGSGFGSAPFVIAAIGYAASQNTLNHFGPAWNNAGTATFGNFGTVVASNVMRSHAATFQVGGNVNAYTNGVQDMTAIAFGPSFTNSSPNRLYIGSFGVNSVTTVVYMWNRILSAAEIAALDQAPYDVFVPIEYDLPILPVPPVSFILMPQIVT